MPSRDASNVLQSNLAERDPLVSCWLPYSHLVPQTASTNRGIVIFLGLILTDYSIQTGSPLCRDPLRANAPPLQFDYASNPIVLNKAGLVVGSRDHNVWAKSPHIELCIWTEFGELGQRSRADEMEGSIVGKPPVHHESTDVNDALSLSKWIQTVDADRLGSYRSQRDLPP